MSVRIIPRLDIKGPNLVKGVQLEGLRVLGRPEAFARRHYEDGADELLYMDVVASLYERNSLHDIIERTSREIFIPLTVGGGLRSLDDIRAVLRRGADKVALNTAAVRRPELIREAAREFGSSTVVVSIEAKRRPNGRYEAYTDNGRERTGVDVFRWAAEAVELGAGEIMITSIDCEGTGAGFDVELTARVAEESPVPVIACGGAGAIDDVYEAITQGRAEAVSMASLLHYQVVSENGGPTEDAGAPSRPVKAFSRIDPCSLPRLKRYLAERGVDCRYEEEAVNVSH